MTKARSTEQPIDIAVVGAGGRMGQTICDLSLRSPMNETMRLVAAIEHDEHARLGEPCSTDHENAPRLSSGMRCSCDVLIDFSTVGGTRDALSLAAEKEAALVVATTGLEPSTFDLIDQAAERIAILVASNTSLGITIMHRLVDGAVKGIGCGSDTRVSMSEAHHEHKRDAPSGTARSLAQTIRESGVPFDDSEVHSMRGGGVIGEHTVRIFGQDEFIEIRHVASSRRLFAAGALRAAAWLAHQAPGRYSMIDVLGAA